MTRLEGWHVVLISTFVGCAVVLAAPNESNKMPGVIGILVLGFTYIFTRKVSKDDDQP